MRLVDPKDDLSIATQVPITGHFPAEGLPIIVNELELPPTLDHLRPVNLPLNFDVP